MSVCALVNEVNLSTLIIYLFQSGSSCNRCGPFYISGENALEGAVAMAALNEVCVCVCVCVCVWGGGGGSFSYLGSGASGNLPTVGKLVKWQQREPASIVFV